MVDTVVGSIDIPEQTQPVPIENPNNTYDVPLPPDVIASRAAKASMGLSNKTDKTEDDFHKAISDGQETKIRQDVSAQLDAAKATAIIDTINQNRFTPEDLTNLTKKTSPDSVFEEHFAKEYLNRMDWPKEEDRRDNWLYHAQIGVPQEYDYVFKNGGSKYLAFTQYLQHIGENAEAARKGQSWAGAIVDVAKDFGSFGIYGETKLRQGAGGTGFFEELGLGSNLEKQSIRLYRLALSDFDAAKKEALTIYNKLASDNPMVAQRWIQAMLGTSQTDRVFDDVFTAANVLGLGGLTKSAAGSSLRRMTSATKDMTSVIPPQIPPRVAAPAVAGNLSESGIQKVVIDRINEFSDKNNPVQELVDRLTANYDIDKTAAASSPGRLGREVANRVSDVIDARKENFISTVINAQRVNKIPATVGTEAGVRRAQAGIADMHRGPDNTVLSVSDPLFVPGQNVFVHNVALGTMDGTLYGSEEEAITAARRQGHIIKGDFINYPKAQQLEEFAQMFDKLVGQTTKTLSKEDRTAIEAFENEGGKVLERSYGSSISDPAKMAATIRERIQELPTHTEGVTVEAQGAGFYLNKLVYLKHDEDFVRDGLITTYGNEHTLSGMTVKQFREDLAAGRVSTGVPPSWLNGWVNAIFGRARNPAERLSITEMGNRIVATHGPGVILGMVKQGYGPIKNIPRSEHAMFNRLLRAGQKEFNEGESVPGKWFDNPFEIENWTQRNFNKVPSPEFIEGYFAYKSLVLDDLNLRNMLVGQYKHELGIEQHNVLYQGTNGKSQSGFFEAAKLRELPSNGKRVLIVSSEGKAKTKDYKAGFIPKAIKDRLDVDIPAGRAKLLQIADPKSRPLGELSSRRIEYVIAYDTENKPLGFNHVNRRGGGHFMPEANFYLKQAHVDDGVYEGDKTIAAFRTKAEAQAIAPHMERVRELFQKHARTLVGQADREAIQRFENEGGLVTKDFLDEAAQANKVIGIPWHKHYDWYFGKSKFLDLNEPFHVVPNGGKIIEMAEGRALEQRHLKVDPTTGQETKLIDGTKGNTLLSKSMIQFTQERDAEGLWTMTQKGTQQNPLFAYEPADILDPVTAMERGYGQIARTMYMGDLKDFGIEHWIQQAKPYLKNPEEVSNAPLAHFYEPKYRDNIEPQIKYQLESNRKQLSDFLNRRSWIDNTLQAIGQSLADSIYRATDGKGKVTMVAMDKLSQIKNPVSFVRNIAFRAIEGMYGLGPFWSQASTMANVWAISPRSAISATAATFMYGMTRFNRNPAVMEYLDKMVANMGLVQPGLRRFKPGEFIEFTQLMESTGFHRIGNEHAFASNALSNKVITKGFSTFVKWGNLPFDIGSASTRVGGFATAYLEWREKNPFGPVDIQARSSILQRAALLDHNMSSAFSTKMHTGAMSIPMQFQAYDLRLAEMMFGKNLTPQEKTRLFTTSALMYGLRGGAFTLVGVPITNQIVGWAETKMGYVPGANPLWDLIMNGVPAGMLAYLSGKGDLSKGTWYNIAKWGNKGIDPLKEVFENDKSMANIILGATGNVFENTFNGSWALRQSLLGMGSDNPFPVTSDNVLDLLKGIQSVSSYRRTWQELKIHKWLTNNETIVSGDQWSTFNSILRAVTGLQPIENADVWAKQKLIREDAANVRWYQRQYGIILARAAQASIDNNDGQARAFYTQARTVLEVNIPREKWSETVALANKNFGTDLLDRVNFDLYIKDKKDVDTFQKIQQVKDKRNQ